jgi:hypothetical protein
MNPSQSPFPLSALDAATQTKLEEVTTKSDIPSATFDVELPELRNKIEWLSSDQESSKSRAMNPSQGLFPLSVLDPATRVELEEAIRKSNIPSPTLDAETSELRKRFELLHKLEGFVDPNAIILIHRAIANQLAHPLGLKALIELFVDVSGGENPRITGPLELAQRKTEIGNYVVHYLVAFMEVMNSYHTDLHTAWAYWTDGGILGGVHLIFGTHQWSEIESQQQRIVPGLIWVMRRQAGHFYTSSGDAYVAGNEATWALSLFNDPIAEDALELTFNGYTSYRRTRSKDWVEFSRTGAGDSYLFRMDLTRLAIESIKRRRKIPKTSQVPSTQFQPISFEAAYFNSLLGTLANSVEPEISMQFTAGVFVAIVHRVKFGGSDPKHAQKEKLGQAA